MKRHHFINILLIIVIVSFIFIVSLFSFKKKTPLKITEVTNGVSYENQGWFALANKKSNAYYIEFQKGYWTFTQKDDVMRFYKNKESFAKRVSELIRKGF